MLLTALLANLVLFSMAWAWSVKIRNFSPVDAFWALGIGLTSCYFLWGNGSPSAPMILASILVGLWALRLSGHLARRIAKHHPSEDSRYLVLRNIWQVHTNRNFFFFFQAQALCVVLLSLPFFLIAKNPSPSWNWLHTLGLLTTLLGLLGEALADRQMAQFKASQPKVDAVCEWGLWKYSRHPNYFFESIIWFGFFFMALPSPKGYLAIFAPITITYLLLKVTGIPPTEAAAIQRKGDAYRDYQLRTSAFIPLPQKKKSLN